MAPGPDRRRWHCIHCSGNHPGHMCRLVRPIADNLPLETPSHNGPYRGTATVRVVPAGVMTDELSPVLRDKALRGITKQRRLRRLNRKR